MVALPFIAMGLAAAGTAVSAAGALNQASYRRKIAEQNTLLAGQNSTSAALRGMANQEQLTIRGSEVIGRQRASAGVSGADVSRGAIVDTIAATRAASALDLLRSRYGTTMEQRGFDVQARNFQAQSELDSMAGAFGAASAIIQGASSIASTAYSMKGAGGYDKPPPAGPPDSAGYGESAYPADFPVFGGTGG